MASYFNASQKESFRSIIDNVHDTFAKQITVILPPTQTINLSSSFNSSYGTNSSGQKPTKIPREQTIEARILYRDSNLEFFESQTEAPLRAKLPVGSVRIKVNSAGNDLMKDAIGVKINNEFYEIVSNGEPTMLFTEHYYSWFLKPSDVK